MSTKLLSPTEQKAIRNQQIYDEAKNMIAKANENVYTIAAKIAPKYGLAAGTVATIIQNMSHTELYPRHSFSRINKENKVVKAALRYFEATEKYRYSIGCSSEEQLQILYEIERTKIALFEEIRPIIELSK